MEKNKITISDIYIDNHHISYAYDIQGEAEKYFNDDNRLLIEYSQNIRDVPIGIAVIPLMTNILPIAWLSNSEIYVPEIDKNFLGCIDDFKNGFVEMYPHTNFKGKVVADKVVNHTYKAKGKTATFFSGGVDSTSTLINRLSEGPDLITIWGSDLSLDEIKGWEAIKKLVEDTTSRFKVNAIFLKSNFRTFINTAILDNDFKVSLEGENWWHGIQHGIGIIGHAAPLAVLNQYSTVFMPASWSKKYQAENKVHLASYPSIDNHVRFAAALVNHESFDYHRQDKIKKICNFSRKNKMKIFIRACYGSVDGDNCCDCEKCSRTIMGIISEGEDPNDYGFRLSENDLKRLKKQIRNKWFISTLQIYHWKTIKENMSRNKHKIDNIKQVEWILSYDFDKVNSSFVKRYKKNINEYKSKLKNKNSLLYDLIKLLHSKIRGNLD